MDAHRERLLWPDVVAATEQGDDNRYFAIATTNNMDTVVKVSTYWHVPKDGEPVLMIEIDDETPDGAQDPMDILIRVRRNDGLVYEGRPSGQEDTDEEDGEEQLTWTRQ